MLVIKLLKALAGTAVVVMAAAGVFLFGYVAQTGIDLSLTVNWVFFWGLNGLILVGTLVTIAGVWAKVFEWGRFAKDENRLVRNGHSKKPGAS